MTYFCHRLPAAMATRRYPLGYNFGAITIFATNINTARRAEAIIVQGHSATNASGGVVWIDGKPIKWRVLLPCNVKGNTDVESRPEE